MEHYITEIKIEKLRHLSDITIPLDPEKRQHLMITGKNGSGKTSLLLALQKYLNAINKGELTKLESEYVKWLRDSEKKLRQAKTEAERFEAEKEYQRWFEWVKKFKDGIEVTFNNAEALDALYAQGRFITAFFPANRKTQIIRCLLYTSPSPRDA